jgi:hypothetical protein
MDWFAAQHPVRFKWDTIGQKGDFDHPNFRASYGNTPYPATEKNGNYRALPGNSSAARDSLADPQGKIFLWGSGKSMKAVELAASRRGCW